VVDITADRHRELNHAGRISYSAFLTGAASHYPGKPVGYVNIISEGLRELNLAAQIQTVKATDLYYTNQILDKVGSLATAR
jgi:hypothetical protein